MDNTAERELFRAMKSAIPGVCRNQSGPVDRDPKTVACEAAYAPSARRLLAERQFVCRRRPDSPMLSSIEELCESGQNEIQD